MTLKTLAKVLSCLYCVEGVAVCVEDDKSSAEEGVRRFAVENGHFGTLVSVNRVNKANIRCAVV